MLTYTIKRLGAFVPMLVGVSLIAFIIIHLLPGDPILVLVSRFELGGEERRAVEAGQDLDADTATALEQLRAQYGLDAPLPVQYGRFIRDAAQGDLGDSILRGRPVVELIKDALPHTAGLALAAAAISVVIGISVGVLSALRYKTWLDSTSIFGSLIAVSMPEFWLAILAILFFTVHLGWLPSSGTSSWVHLILPASVLGVRSAGSIARMTRSTTIEALSRPFVMTARAKGLRERVVVVGHALRNALIPVVTLIGLELGRLLSGTVVIETIFARPGLGRLLINSILESDVRVLQGAIMVIALIYLVVNLLVDLSYAALNPRIRYQ